MSKWGETATTTATATIATITIETIAGGTTPTPQLVSAQAVSLSARENAVATKLPRSRGTTAAGSHGGSASATKTASLHLAPLTKTKRGADAGTARSSLSASRIRSLAHAGACKGGVACPAHQRHFGLGTAVADYGRR